MSLAIFFFSQAIITWSCYQWDNRTKKRIHACFHLIAIALVMAGAWATLQFHVNTKLPHFFSLHSWFGLITFLVILIQSTGALITFVFETPTLHNRVAFIPYHRVFGILALVSSGMTALGGLIQYQVYHQARNWMELYEGSSVLINFIGITLVLTVLTVLGTVFITRAEEERGETARLIHAEPDLREPISSM